jgi:hypothetical protein
MLHGRRPKRDESGLWTTEPMKPPPKNLHPPSGLEEKLAE